MSKKLKIKMKPGKAKIKMKGGTGELPLSAGQIQQLLGAVVYATAAARRPALVAAPLEPPVLDAREPAALLTPGEPMTAAPVSIPPPAV